jgi:hypothetical protein
MSTGLWIGQRDGGEHHHWATFVYSRLESGPSDAEEQFHGVLGDRGGETKGSFEELAEVRGGDYLGHHRWVVFHSGDSLPCVGGQKSGQWTATPGLRTRSRTESLGFLVLRAGKDPNPQCANLLALRAADLPPMASAGSGAQGALAVLWRCYGGAMVKGAIPHCFGEERGHECP